ncbi:MAG: adenylate cyclase [Sphingomicrobium sp.]
MATRARGARGKSAQRGYMVDQAFFTRYAIVLVLFILFGFAQFAMRGFSSPLTAPPIVHLHGGLMVAFLGLFIAQNMLVHRGELALHRKLGWAAVVLVVGIAVVGPMVGRNSLATNHVPPFFTAPYFLSLTTVQSLMFAGMVGWAITLRRDTQWHRRAMFGAMMLLLEPALGRLLPMPLMGHWGEWVALAIQLVFVAVIARHDRKVLGAVHPATVAIAGLVIFNHVLVSVVAMLPPVVAYASAVAAG